MKNYLLLYQRKLIKSLYLLDFKKIKYEQQAKVKYFII